MITAAERLRAWAVARWQPTAYRLAWLVALAAVHGTSPVAAPRVLRVPYRREWLPYNAPHCPARAVASGYRPGIGQSGGQCQRCTALHLLRTAVTISRHHSRRCSLSEAAGTNDRDVGRKAVPYAVRKGFSSRRAWQWSARAKQRLVPALQTPRSEHNTFRRCHARSISHDLQSVGRRPSVDVREGPSIN